MAREIDIFEKPPADGLTAKQLGDLLARVRAGELTLQRGSNPEKFYVGKSTGLKGVMRVAVVAQKAALNTHRVELAELAK